MKLHIWRFLCHYPKLVFVTIFLSAISWCITFAVQAKSSSSYGLGIVQHHYVDYVGQIRCPDLGNLVAVDLLAPDDGAKTLSSRPTFYWYIEHKSLNDVKTEKSFYIDFILKSSFGQNAKSIFRSRSKGILKANSGLYRFTLPPNSPALEVGKTYTWQIRYVQSDDEQSDNYGSQIDARNFVMLENNPSIMNQIKLAATDLDRARIFAKNLYWYDALDEYTKWIDGHPNDIQALRERLSMLDQIVRIDPKLKCIGKYNVNNTNLINSKQSIPQIMR